jgi:large subunit ribosomal protein L14e
MPVFDIGRVAVKTLGREAGEHCVVVDIIDKNYVLIDGINVRRRRSNVNHLVPTKDKVDIKKGISKEDLKKAIDKAKMTDKLKSKIKIDL